MSSVLVTGGAGYVGSCLVPRLLEAGHKVTVLDLYLYGDNVLENVKQNPALREIKGDLRNPADVKNALRGCDSVIHLACISNDPSFELDVDLGKSINYDCFRPLVKMSKDAGIKRFIYASSSSVYGLRKEQNVTEKLELKPLTDYSKFKAMCEDVLIEEMEPGFTSLILRPATVCGYSPRLRLDLTVNILTNHAINNRIIKVFGGDQMRPNIHIEDISALYVKSLTYDSSLIDGQIFNVGYENHTVMNIANMVQDVIKAVSIEVTPTDDNRSYHISSEKIKKALNFEPEKTISDAISDLSTAFGAGKIPNSMEDPLYFNIKQMQRVGLS